jgi:iron complex outermembrane receptor protein
MRHITSPVLPVWPTGGRQRLATWLCAAAAVLPAPAQALAPRDLAELSLEELADIPVTSVTGRPQAAQRATASVFVISGEDIRRSAATSLAEALRLAPNLQVARLNATQYAISARGFNNAIGNKLLVLVDGRTVYSPLYSGVFWDAQQVVLEDIDRIEVISGPGATLWGANAVNGVINVITHAAATTQGTLVVARAGSEGNELTVRQGGSFGDDGAYRVYATRVEAESTALRTGADSGDASTKKQAGFRADWRLRDSQATVQGDVYDTNGDGQSSLAPRMSGGNLLGRWEGGSADEGTWQLQAYFDTAERRDTGAFANATRTLDVQFNHAPVLSSAHQLLWGGGYRLAHNEADPTAFTLFLPAARNLRWANVFVQDEVQVAPRLRVTLGTKVETNIYTGAEWLPTLRAAWDFDDNRMLWGGVSRAVRAPARVDRDFYLHFGPVNIINGGPNFDSEVAVVTELGYRAPWGQHANYSLTAFNHHYNKLRAGRRAPTEVENLAFGDVHGVEGWGNLDLATGWRLSAGFVELRESLKAAPQAGANSVANLGNDPKHQWMLRSTQSIGSRVELDATLRRVSALPQPAVPGYTAADLRAAWKVHKGLTASLQVQNLFDRRHVEFDPAGNSEWGRAVYVKLEVRLP